MTATSPTSITLEFSWNINPSSIQATDLVLSGSADNPSAPVHATSLTWIDGDTVQFNLSGPLSLPGTLDVSIAPNMIHGVNRAGRTLAYTDSVVLQIGTPPGVVNPTPYPVTNPTSPGTPVTTPTGNQPPTVTPTPVYTTPAPAPSPVTLGKLTKKQKHAEQKAGREEGGTSRPPSMSCTSRPPSMPRRKPAKKAVQATAGSPRRSVADQDDHAVHPEATISLGLSAAGQEEEAQ